MFLCALPSPLVQHCLFSHGMPRLKGKSTLAASSMLIPTRKLMSRVFMSRWKSGEGLLLKPQRNSLPEPLLQECFSREQLNIVHLDQAVPPAAVLVLVIKDSGWCVTNPKAREGVVATGHLLSNS